MKILLAFLFSIAAVSVNAQTQVLVERPAVKAGDSWTYRSTDGWNGKVLSTSTLEVTTVGAVIELLSKSKSGAVLSTITETPDTNTVSRVPTKGNTVQYSPDSGRIVFPLSVGKTWAVKNSFALGEVRRGSEELTATVDGWEEITTPAGKFSALKLTWSGYYRSSNGSQSGTGKLEVTLWYSPVVKRSVKSIYKEYDWNGQLITWAVSELLSYSVN